MDLKYAKIIHKLDRMISQWNNTAITANSKQHIKAHIEWVNSNPERFVCVVSVVNAKYDYNTRHNIMWGHSARGRTDVTFPGWCNYIVIDKDPLSLHSFYMELRKQMYADIRKIQ